MNFSNLSTIMKIIERQNQLFKPATTAIDFAMKATWPFSHTTADSIAQSVARSNEQFRYLEKFSQIQGLSFIPSGAQNAIEKSLSHHFTLSESLVRFSRSMENFHGMASVNLSLYSILDKAIGQSIAFKAWDDLELIEENLEKVNEVTEAIVEEGFTQERINQIEELLRIILGKVSQSKFDKIWFYISMVIVALTAVKDSNEFYNGLDEISNKEAINQINTNINAKFDFINKKQDNLNFQIQELKRKISVVRYAIRDSRLYQHPDTTSNVLATVKENQYITVLNSNHKWLCISYFDDFTRQPKSGWVLKKYFKLEN